ncbi:hypothetical protein [Psittacicella hinzii]|uniref:Uncharacterized protein n=1 Tax=Psittacicella hinzii TaxID=2028575 RepID=A0A3A1YBV6_9GAMM|nr:hypothetical protein [Psittacicella hinzii]RIY34856.1 hypothetical protein CKF58_07555 [Psittacicella hinzii]
MFGDILNKASQMMDTVKSLKDIDLSNPAKALDSIKELNFDDAKTALQNLLPKLPLGEDLVSGFLGKLEEATANNETIHAIVEKVKEYLAK